METTGFTVCSWIWALASTKERFLFQCLNWNAFAKSWAMCWRTDWTRDQPNALKNLFFSRETFAQIGWLFLCLILKLTNNYFTQPINQSLDTFMQKYLQSNHKIHHNSQNSPKIKINTQSPKENTNKSPFNFLLMQRPAPFQQYRLTQVPQLLCLRLLVFLHDTLNRWHSRNVLCLYPQTVQQLQKTFSQCQARLNSWW